MAIKTKGKRPGKRGMGRSALLREGKLNRRVKESETVDWNYQKNEGTDTISQEQKKLKEERERWLVIQENACGRNIAKKTHARRIEKIKMRKKKKRMSRNPAKKEGEKMWLVCRHGKPDRPKKGTY